jgi:hypothetical protein
MDYDCWLRTLKSGCSAPTLKQNHFGFEPEVTAKVARANAGFNYQGRTCAEGMKIGRKDGVHAIRSILREASVQIA